MGRSQFLSSGGLLLGAQLTGAAYGMQLTVGIPGKTPSTMAHIEVGPESAEQATMFLSTSQGAVAVARESLWNTYAAKSIEDLQRDIEQLKGEMLQNKNTYAAKSIKDLQRDIEQRNEEMLQNKNVIEGIDEKKNTFDLLEARQRAL
eukprot:g16048.t1